MLVEGTDNLHQAEVEIGQRQEWKYPAWMRLYLRKAMAYTMMVLYIDPDGTVVWINFLFFVNFSTTLASLHKKKNANSFKLGEITFGKMKKCVKNDAANCEANVLLRIKNLELEFCPSLILLAQRFNNQLELELECPNFSSSWISFFLLMDGFCAPKKLSLLLDLNLFCEVTIHVNKESHNRHNLSRQYLPRLPLMCIFTQQPHSLGSSLIPWPNYKFMLYPTLRDAWLGYLGLGYPNVTMLRRQPQYHGTKFSFNCFAGRFDRTFSMPCFH
uniref:Uncharacterized protein n=1 Tax=Glossina austeni TaxID=7395 RepID=A0A1A9UF53_GLOAU